MAAKYLVSLSRPTDAQAVRDAGCEIVAEYPDTLIAVCEDAQAAALRTSGLEIDETPTAPVRMRGMQFAMADAVATEAAVAAPEPNRPGYYIAQFVGPPKGDWLASLAELGAEQIASLPGEALIVRATPEALDAIRPLDFVESVASYRPAMKLSPKLRRDRLATLESAELTMSAEDTVAEQDQLVEISLFPGESVDDLAAKVEGAGGQIFGRTDTSLRTVAGPAVLQAVAADNGVESIQPFEFPETHNDVARDIMDVPANGAFSSGDLEGAGQIVAVCDSGLDTGNMATVHRDFRNRVDAIVSLPVALDPSFGPFVNGPLVTDDGPADTNSGHGTHVVGSVLGDGTEAIAAGAPTIPVGTAPQARLFFQASEQAVNFKPVQQLQNEGLPVPANWPPRPTGLYGLPPNLMPLFQAAYNGGARVHTNSWGSPLGGQYTQSSIDVDRFMWENRDFLLVFSAGNSGVDPDQDGQINADSIGAPGTAKNCLTVGASENQRPNGSNPTPGANANWTQFQFPRFSQMGAAGHVSDNPGGMACFSSRGPTDDGRLKPEVVAPGTNVLSTRSSPAGPGPLWGDVTPASNPLSGLYCWSGGTSMSTPLVAGLAACVREHLVIQRGHFQDGVTPSGALVKAFILNGANAISGQFGGEVPAGVNNVTGFGRANGVSTITPGQLARVAFDDEPVNAVETGQIRTFPIEAANLSEPLKVTLCWTDRQSTTAGGLQNQLYLQLVDPGAPILNGDVTPFPSVTNNSQQITVPAPVAGVYTIRVRGVSVAHQAPGAAIGANPRQDFALAASNVIGLNVAPPPVVLVGGIVNGASFQFGAVSTGELLTIFGGNLGPNPARGLELDANGNVVTQLADTRALFDGLPVPVIFASPSQINVVAPTFPVGQSSVTVQVEVDGVVSNATVLGVTATRPGIFTIAGGGQGAVVNQNGTVNGTTDPAPPGSVIQIYVTGGGQTNPALVVGGIAPVGGPLHNLNANVDVQIGGVNAPVQFAGSAPGLIFGVVQINVEVPQGVAAGGAVALQVSIGGTPAQAGVTVAIG